MPLDWIAYTFIIAVVLAFVGAFLFSLLGEDGVERGFAGTFGFVWLMGFFFGIWFWGWVIYIAVHFIGKHW